MSRLKNTNQRLAGSIMDTRCFYISGLAIQINDGRFFDRIPVYLSPDASVTHAPSLTVLCSMRSAYSFHHRYTDCRKYSDWYGKKTSRQSPDA